MTTKTLTGIYSSGYTLSASYSALSVAASATVDGAYVAFGGGAGGAGVTIDLAAPLLNNGNIAGGYGDPQGGVGVLLAAGGSITNGTGTIVGGDGGYIGGGGVVLTAGGSVSNISGAIAGGAGGTYSLTGGAGGAGINAAAFALVTNAAQIKGGDGGEAASFSADGGGAGGAAVIFSAGGSLSNSGSVEGGAGETGGSDITDPFSIGGSGGSGICLTGGGAANNTGAITGGYGGDGEGVGGVGGVGVTLAGGATLTNSGAIDGGGGGNGIADGAYIFREGFYFGGPGGAGATAVNATGYATIVNTGEIVGGQGGEGASGYYVYPTYSFYRSAASGVGGTGVILAAGGSVINTGVIGGGPGGGGWTPAGPGIGVVLTAGGSVRNGVKTVPSATISGLVGVDAGSGGAATVTNFGTIVGTSGTAVQFGSASGRLIAMAGSMLIGQALGGGGTLELASTTGTITGLGLGGTVSGAMTMGFAGFNAFQLDGGAWTLSGSPSLAAGQVLDAQGASTTTVTGSLTNAGLLEATTVAGLILSAATIANSGGTITVGAGSKALLEGVTIMGGVVSSTGGGKILTANGTANTLDGSVSSITLPTLTSLTVADTTYLTVVGSIANSGKISLSASTHSAELIIGGTGVTLSGGGAVTLGANANNLIGGAVGVVLTNVDNSITGSGQIGGGSLVIVNQAKGLIEQTGAVALNVATGSRTIVNAGTIEAAGAGGMTVKSAIANTGLLEAVKGNLTVMLAVTGTGSAVVNAATLYFASSFNQNVRFSGTTGVLELAKSTAYTATITGFSKTGGTQLDLLDISFVTGTTKATFVGNTTSGILTVTDGVHTANINLTGNYTKSTFVVATDNHGGTLIHDPTAPLSPQSTAMASAMASMVGSCAATATMGPSVQSNTPVLALPGSA